MGVMQRRDFLRRSLGAPLRPPVNGLDRAAIRIDTHAVFAGTLERPRELEYKILLP